MSCTNVVRGAAALLGALIAAQSMAATPDELVCREQRRPGSRIVMRVCATDAQWTVAATREAVIRKFPNSVEYPATAGTASAPSAVSVAQNR